jgi:hypothetical protein
MTVYEFEAHTRVESGPEEDFTRMRLPEKPKTVGYCPGATSTVSPSTAAEIAA